ncbi:MAG TPA: hypothetical protein DC017_13920 [Candidatus Wallbacteria bacterium]|nr:hypothetical protein [Candidatus Wallbacteria bacterium]
MRPELLEPFHGRLMTGPLGYAAIWYIRQPLMNFSPYSIAAFIQRFYFTFRAKFRQQFSYCIVTCHRANFFDVGKADEPSNFITVLI